MRFRTDWRAPVIWISLSAFNLVVTLLHIHRHGIGSIHIRLQLVSWALIFVVWSFMFSLSWRFDTDKLVLKRLLLPDVDIPYANISSVDWIKRQHISITLAAAPVFRETERRTVIVRDVPGFLSEMERHVSPSLIHA